MTSYSTLAEVKSKLTYTKATYDAHLTTLLERAYAYINVVISKYETVPFASPDDLILEIESKLAAGWFRAERLEDEEEENKWGQRMVKEAKELLMEFIKANYLESGDTEDLYAETGWHNYATPSYEQDLG